MNDVVNHKKKKKKVRFELSNNHKDTSGEDWRRSEMIRIRNKRRPHENSRRKARRRAQGGGLTKSQIRRGVLDGTISYGASDTGATSTAGKYGDHFIASNEPSSKVFGLPTGGSVKATQKATLDLPLKEAAREVDMVPGLAQTLISTGKITDAGYTAVYDKDEVNFYPANKIHITEESVLQGYRCPRTKLWRIPLMNTVTNDNMDTILLDSPCGMKSKNTTYVIPTTAKVTDHIRAMMEIKEESISNVYELPSLEQAIRYLHAAAGFPTKTTWLKAIRRGNYSTWPLLTVANVHKYFPESEETQYGHLRGQRQGVRRTGIKPTNIPQQDTTNNNEEQPALEKKNDVYIKTFDTKDFVYSDQTGANVMTSQGNKYQMVMFHVDSNSIFVEALKNRTEGEMILARRRALQRMKLAGVVPKTQVLDNEASKAYKEEIIESGMDYQLVPPDDHRRNVAEKAIQTWKDHFISVMCGTADSFPLHLWDQCIPQMELQLCLLRQSNANPKISTYAHLYGHHNYNAVPFVPIGMETIVHEKPNRRKSWAKHGKKGYVIGTSREHYRCYKTWIKETRATRVSGTVFFKHKYLTNPTVTPEDAIVAAANNLSNAIKRNMTAQQIGEQRYNDIVRLQEIFTYAAQLPRVQDMQNKNDEHASTEEENRQKQTNTERVSEEQPEEHPPELVQNNNNNNEEEELVREASLPRVTRQTVSNTASSPRVETVPPLELSYEESTPAQNTRSKAITITQEAILRTIEITDRGFNALQASRRRFNQETLAAVLNEETGELMEYRHLVANPKYRDTWSKAYGIELGRLAQGINDVEGTDTIVFIAKGEVPQDRWRDVRYGRICANYRPEKEDPNRIRLTFGGSNMNVPIDCGTPTADMLTVKVLLNSVVSTKNAKFMTIDIKNFYLCTPMERPEYMKLKIADMPENIIQQYNLRELETRDGYVYVKIQKGMYGLPQAGIIAQQLLEKRLNKAGYRQSKITPGFWTHDWRPISFALVVDDFGVKYVGKEHAEHLLNVLTQDYETSHEWEGTRYIGLTLDWDYIQRMVHLSMPEYCEKARQRFQHEMPKKPQDQPYPHLERTYGAKQQYAEEEDTSPVLNKEQKTFIQEVIGTYLYYARAVDCTMLTALGTLATQQANPTENTMKNVKQFLDYASSHQDAMVTYRASDMVLAVHSDASYLSERKARSRAGGHFFMSEDETFPANNGAVLTIAQIIKAVMSSAAEAELGALYINSREAIPIRHLLEEMGHKQPPTPIQVDNSTALGVVKQTIQPKRTKAMDMRFHWLRCRKNQGQFRTYWREGPTNNGDYVTKHHPAIHHTAVRPVFLTSASRLRALKERTQQILSRLNQTARVC